MKRFFSYILILVVAMGIFIPAGKIYAITDPLGTCKNGTAGQPILDITKQACVAKGEGWIWTSYYYTLAPLPCTTDPNNPTTCVDGKLTTFDTTQTSNLGAYLNLMIKLFIGICAVLAVVMIVMGGIEYMTNELVSNKEEGKKRITNAIFGLLLALGAWLLLYTINPDLLKVDLNSLASVTVVVDLQDNVPQPQPVNGQTYPNSNYKFGDAWGDNIGAIQNIPGVTKNFPECTTVGQPPGCLSTRNLNLSAINNIKTKCPGAPLALNGGTEFWHHGGATGNTTHGPGSSTVDLAPNSALNTCLSGGKPLVSMTRYPAAGGPYYYEGNHWHIGG